MKLTIKYFIFSIALLSLGSCGSLKKQIVGLETELASANSTLDKYGATINDYDNKLKTCNQEKERLRGLMNSAESNLGLREEQIQDLKDQIDDIRTQRDRQVEQVGDLTVLSQSASENIKETLSQLEQKDEYIHLIQAARTKADSINLALAVNLKSVLDDGIRDNDIEVKVDKTVVFINLSDKMLYQSGSSRLTPKANDVLGKISRIVQSKPGMEVMVEGYTDNVPMRSSCIEDNWDLSVKRATSVVRALQNNFGVDPNRLIAAGRGEYNVLADNSTSEGRSMNRRTRIIILPQLDQFYDLLGPDALGQ